MGKKIDTDNLLGSREIAELLHVKLTTAIGWYDRQVHTHFPDPVFTTGQARITRYWDREEVLEWYRNWNPRRQPTKVGYLDEDLAN